MTDDLVSRLRAAIEAKAAKAEEADNSPWSYFGGLVSAWDQDNDGAPATVARCDEADGEHIADNDPAATLAMCAAHRQIVDLFALIVQIQDEAAAQIRAARFDAPSAMVYKRWSRAHTEVGIMRPLVEALAKGYGLPTE